jgi:hypothetical protein
MGLSNILGSPTKHQPASPPHRLSPVLSPLSHTSPHVVAHLSNDLKPAPQVDTTSPHVVAHFSNDLKPAPRADVISTHVVAHFSNDLKPAPRADTTPSPCRPEADAI